MRINIQNIEAKKLRSKKKRHFISMTIAFALTYTFLILFGWNAWKLYNKTKTESDYRLKIEKLRSTIVYIDEVLTMSARMAVLEGDLKWEERYRSHELELDAAIKEAINLGSNAPVLKGAKETAAANTKLVKMENRSFDLVRQGRLNEAKALLFSADYKEQKIKYAQGMGNLKAGLSVAASTSLKDEQRKAFMGVGIAFLLILFLCIILFVVFQVLRRWEESLISKEELEEEIDERRIAELALRESERRFRDITQSMADWIWEVDKNGTYTYVSETVQNILGYTAEELIGRTPFETMSEKEAVKIKEIFLQIFSKPGPIVDLENWNLARDGTKVCLLTNGVPIIGVDGELHGYRGVDKDITIQKNLEVERAAMEAQLQQAQKMESVGRLAGGVAHDYNNALSVIIGFTEQVIDAVDPSGPLHADLEEVLKAAKRATEITRQLLAFARKQIIAPKVIDLNKNVGGMLNMLLRLIGEDIDLAWLPGKSLWPVKVDPSQIDQILANLCVNARDAIEGVGKVTVETDTVVFDSAYCTNHIGFTPGEFVLLAVSDNGCGMNKKILDNIFEPFFTTKDVDKGTGLGLATVYGIVKQNNGFINVYSEPGNGTTIKIYLPRHEGKSVEIQRASTTETLPGRGETVLLVEDDLSILTLCKKVLDRLGYTVLPAGSPGEAMGIAEEHTGEIHILVTDVIMPEMNGRELGQRLQPLYPDLKRLYMSGYTSNAIAHHGVLDEGVQFIQKPFSYRDLATTVRKMLDE